MCVWASNSAALRNEHRSGDRVRHILFRLDYLSQCKKKNTERNKNNVRWNEGKEERLRTWLTNAHAGKVNGQSEDTSAASKGMLDQIWLGVGCYNVKILATTTTTENRRLDDKTKDVVICWVSLFTCFFFSAVVICLERKGKRSIPVDYNYANTVTQLVFSFPSITKYPKLSIFSTNVCPSC